MNHLWSDFYIDKCLYNFCCTLHNIVIRMTKTRYVGNIKKQVEHILFLFIKIVFFYHRERHATQFWNDAYVKRILTGNTRRRRTFLRFSLKLHNIMVRKTRIWKLKSSLLNRKKVITYLKLTIARLRVKVREIKKCDTERAILLL